MIAVVVGVIVWWLWPRPRRRPPVAVVFDPARLTDYRATGAGTPWETGRNMVGFGGEG